MCFQEFLYYHCGHSQIINIRCESAAEHPFYLATACPDYDTKSTLTMDRCGAGRFYCLDHPDGKFLDYLFHSRIQTATAIERVRADLHSVRLASQSFHDEFVQLGLHPQSRFTHPTYCEIVLEHKAKQQYLMDLQAQLDEAHDVLEHARRYFQYRQVFESYCGTATPIATPVIGFELLPPTTSSADVEQESPLTRKSPPLLAGMNSVIDPPGETSPIDECKQDSQIFPSPAHHAPTRSRPLRGFEIKEA